MRAMSRLAASLSGTGLGLRRMFIGQALRSALKPACISLETARAMARAETVLGHRCFSGNNSARYSMMARDSHTTCRP